MNADLAPLNAIDPDAQHKEWRRSFEWHLDQVPPLMETMGVLRMPSIKTADYGLAAEKVSGGGYVDNIPVVDMGNGVTADARIVWSMLVEYCRAVVEWTGADPPKIAADARTWTSVLAAPDADPLSARGVALESIGWLIDHADQIEPISELDEFREQLFAEIRRARGRYRGAGTRRRARPRLCGICGECAVIVDWMTPANGSPKPVQVGKCTVCGQLYTDEG